MAGVLTKTTLRGAAAIALLTFVGCSGPSPHQTPPPPNSVGQGPAPSLMGGAPGASDNSGLLGGPGGSRAQAVPPASTSNPKYLMRLVTYRRADGVLVTAMRPVKNPEDMTAAERRQTYGNRYAPRAHVIGHSHAYSVAQATPPKPAAKPVQVVAARPLPPVTPAVAPKAVISEVAKPAPVVTAAMTPPPGGLPAPSNPKLAALQTAVGGEVSAGSKLTVPEGLAKGETAQVSLSLPQTLLAMIQREAGKLGLGKAAKKADVTATLSGEGYEITPNGPQTAKLKLGEAPSFNWQVKPGAGEKGPLKADVDASLKGLKLPMNFSLASLEQAVKAALPPPAPRAKGSLLDKLAIPGMPTVKIPGFGVVPSKSVVAVGLLLLGLALLVAIARNAGESARRNERRRKFRTMTDTGGHSVEVEDHGHGLAAPLAAAAAGAAAAGVISAAHGHDDHGHDDHSHGHDDHGHAPAAAHDDHGHDGHGHGHDDHGHAAAAHDDHGHGHDDHGHAPAAAHDDHGHGHDDHSHGHDDHGHVAAAHDDHGHGHDDHGHAPAAAHDDHGHDDHGHDDHGHGHDDHGHAKELEHAH